MIRSVAMAVVLAGGLALASTASADPAGWSPPRAADGHPDLSGVWSNASVTKLTRPAGLARLAVSEAEAAALAKAAVRGLDADGAPSEADARPPEPGNVGGYNAFWLDPGRTVARVNGEFRTSWIVEPADGQLPLSDMGRELVGRARVAARQADSPAGPEALAPWDRCLISSRGSGGPGMLNNIYNSNYQIVQTPDSVAIVVEMVHDARAIPLFGDRSAAQAGHGPAALHPWLGDSVGWWEGDSLVVETVHVHPEQGRWGPIYLSPQGRVTERFTRVSERQILYEFKVEDPVYYSRAWRAEMSLTASKDLVYEYACHEGNYAMGGILAGARREEAAAAAR